MQCNQCGKCCKSYYLSFTDEDFTRWGDDFGTTNPIVDGYVTKDDIIWKDGFLHNGRYKPGDDKACPYLMYQPHIGKFICRIHHIKPDVCREYVCGTQKGAPQWKQ